MAGQKSPRDAGSGFAETLNGPEPDPYETYETVPTVLSASQHQLRFSNAGVVRGDPSASAWVMLFYGKAFFVALTAPEHGLAEIERSFHEQTL